MSKSHEEWMQLSAAEVPGFNARTQCDDAIGKLWALRNQLREPVPDGLEGLLDDLDEILEKAVELGLDPEADHVELDGVKLDVEIPEPIRRYAGGRLAASGAKDVFWVCSCGGMGFQ